jgi:hypothetical protein
MISVIEELKLLVKTQTLGKVQIYGLEHLRGSIKEHRGEDMETYEVHELTNKFCPLCMINK